MASDGTHGTADVISTTLKKLPQLNAEHLKAITASFPGRLLGRTAALLSLAVLSLAWFRLFEWALPPEMLSLREAYPRLFNLVYYGVPIVVVLGQIVREGIEARRKRRMAARIIEGVVADPTYFRLSPYTNSDYDRQRYYRADRADERVAEWIKRAPTSVLFLSGDSGVGKSSLIEAGTLPRLAGEGFHIVSVRAFADPIAAMLDAVAADGLISRSGNDVNPLSMLQRAARRLARENGRLLVVIDQAEEILVVTPEVSRIRFLDLLRVLSSEPLPGLVVLLVLRSEYELALAELGLFALRHGEAWFKVGAFTEPAARAFLERSGLRLAESQLSRVLKGATALEQTPGLYRPIVLNMLGLILARFAGSLPEHLDLERLIQHHLHNCITRADIADDARRVLPAMITEAGTKWPRREAEIADLVERPVGNVRYCLQTLALSDAGIVRALGNQQALIWEIAHDFLSLQLGLLLGRLKHSWQQRALSYALPLLALIWLIFLGAGTALWPEVAYHRAKSRLAEAGYIVRGNRSDGHSIRHDLVEDTCDPSLRWDRLDRLRSQSQNVSQSEWRVLVSNLPRLTPVISLEIGSYAELHSLEGLPQLEALRDLTIFSNHSLTALAGLPSFPALSKLTICNNEALGSLVGLPQLPALTSLLISGRTTRDTPTLTSLAGFPNLPALKKLTISDTKLTSLSELPKLPVLTELAIIDNINLTSLDGLRELSSLTSLKIAGNDKLVSLSGLPNLATLISLEIGKFTLTYNDTYITRLSSHALTSLAGLPPMPDLRSLTISGGMLTSLSGLPELPALTNLEISNHGNLKSLEGLPDLPSLTSLYITYTPLLTSLAGMRDLPNLQTLEITDSRLVSLTGLPKLLNLREMTITENQSLTSLEGMDLPMLKKLRIESNSSLTSLADLSQIPALAELDILYNPKIISFAKLADLPNLVSLVVNGGRGEADANDLASTVPRLRSIERLAIGGQGAEAVLIAAAQLPRLGCVLLEDTAEMRDAARRLYAARGVLPQPQVTFSDLKVSEDCIKNGGF